MTVEVSKERCAYPYADGISYPCNSCLQPTRHAFRAQQGLSGHFVCVVCGADVARDEVEANVARITKEKS